MTDVALTHVIGTLVLLMLMATISGYAATRSTQANLDISAVSLQEVSERVATEIISLVDLSTVSGNASFTYKVIDVPYSINNQGYNMTLSQGSKSWEVVAYLLEYNFVRGQAKLFFSSGNSSTTPSKGLTCVTTTGSFTITSGGRNLELFYGPSLSSGVGKAIGSTSKAVVWCQIYQDGNVQKLLVGFGRLKVA
jgi:hypothetical protein